jgi:hypothetical protein
LRLYGATLVSHIGKNRVVEMASEGHPNHLPEGLASSIRFEFEPGSGAGGQGNASVSVVAIHY